VEPGQKVMKDTPLVLMYDAQLAEQMHKLESDIAAAQQEELALEAELVKAKPEQRIDLNAQKDSRSITRHFKSSQLQEIRNRVHAVPGAATGYFFVESPIDGTVLNQSFREELTNKSVKPNEPILRVGKKEGRWEIEVKIPQKHIGQVLRAFDPPNDPNA